MVLLTIPGYQCERLFQLMYDKPVPIILPDGIPKISEIKIFVESLKGRPDFLEPLARSDGDPISIGESLTQAYDQMKEKNLPTPNQCDKYYHLLNEPKYRTTEDVKEFVSRDRHIDDVEQPHANVDAKLVGEAQYNALSRLSLIHETLLSEGIGVLSSIDVRVQKSLVQCIQYYKERHERAIDGLNEYIWDKRIKIPMSAGLLTRLERDLDQTMKKISSIEKEMGFPYLEDVNNVDDRILESWLAEMASLRRLIQRIHPFVPKRVKSFLEDNEIRSERFEVIGNMLDKVDRIQRRIQELEAQDGNLAELRDVLVEMHELVAPNRLWLPKEYDFISNERRQAKIVGSLYRARNNGSLPKPTMLISLRQPMSKNTPELSDIADSRPTIIESEDESESLKPFSLTKAGIYQKEKVLTKVEIVFYVPENFDKMYSKDKKMMIYVDVINHHMTELERDCKQEKDPHAETCAKYQQLLQLYARQ